jgi:hypothetical protein
VILSGSIPSWERGFGIKFAPGRDVTVVGDVGGFGAGSEFSWQAVATYGFDLNCFGSPLHTVIGYRALASARTVGSVKMNSMLCNTDR